MLSQLLSRIASVTKTMTTIKAPQCQRWCYTHSRTWAVKCAWASNHCSACPECDRKCSWCARGQKTVVMRKPYSDMRIPTGTTSPTTSPSTSTPPASEVCPKCGTMQPHGKVSCCGVGGTWFNKCGRIDDPNFEHTYADGLTACKGTLVADRTLRY